MLLLLYSQYSFLLVMLKVSLTSLRFNLLTAENAYWDWTEWWWLFQPCRRSDNASSEPRDIPSATQHAVLRHQCCLFPSLSKIVWTSIFPYTQPFTMYNMSKKKCLIGEMHDCLAPGWFDMLCVTAKEVFVCIMDVLLCLFSRDWTATLPFGLNS